MIIYLGPPLPVASSGSQRRNGADGQPSFLGLAPGRGLPSQHLSMLLVRLYRTLAPLPVPANRPSAVCFCGTLLTVTRTGRYPASLAIGEPGLSSTRRRHEDGVRSRSPRLLSNPIMTFKGAVAQLDRATVSQTVGRVRVPPAPCQSRLQPVSTTTFSGVVRRHALASVVVVKPAP